MKLFVPVKTYNLTNARTHWRVRSKRVREQREAVTYELLGADWSSLPKPTPETPWDVLLVRLSPGTLDDDGVVSALKAPRDAIAAYVGVDDRHKHIIKYDYSQEKSREYAVRIEVTPRVLEASRPLV